jgi:hypothetical protein
MAKRFLQLHGVPRGEGDSVHELAERISGYAASGKLPAKTVAKLIRDLWECGDKRVYLFAGEPRQLRAFDSSQFETVLVESLEEARVRVQPARPTANYVFKDAKTIRISYSETHQSIVVDREAREVRQVPVTRLAVLHAELASGAVTMYFDTPGFDHPHGESAAAFIEHYRTDVFPTMLGVQLEDVDLSEVLTALDGDEYRPLVRHGSLRGKVAGGMGVRFNGEGRADLRDYKFFKETHGDIPLRSGGRLFWNETPGERDINAARDGEALLREISTDVHAAPAMIRFARHTLSEEMDYVLRKLRSIA